MKQAEPSVVSRERAEQEIALFDRRRSTMLSEDEETALWYNAEIIKDISKGVRRRLVFVLLICAAFILAESVGAYYSRSIAIFTDVAHLVSDFIGFLFSLISLSLASRQADLSFTYGFVRAEVLGALFSLVMVWGLTIWIFYEATLRLINKEYSTLDPLIMVITAFGALFVNLLMGFITSLATL